MSNAITEAHSLEHVVEIINDEAGDLSGYYGGYDTRSAEAQAGQWAWEAAEESGGVDDESITAQLRFLAEAGAKFDFNAALKNALSRKIEHIVESINEDTQGYTFNYFFGEDLHSAEEKAGHRALEAAEESGGVDDESITAQLRFLAETGAKFDFNAALKSAQEKQ